MKTTMIALVVGTLLLGACGGSEEPATTYLDDYASQVSALKASLKTHATEIAAAADVTAMGPMEQSHMHDVSGDFDGMNQDIGMMGMCANAQGGMMSTGMMGPLVTQAQAECARHENAMMNAADMTAAMKEEDVHQAAMATMMGQMMQMHDQMMGGSATSGGMMGGGTTGGGMMGSGSYTCPAMNAP